MRSLSEHLAAAELGRIFDSLADPSAPGELVDGHAGGSCGVLSQYRLRVVDGVITAADARVRGRAAAYAAASALCEAAVGRSVLDAAALGLQTLHASFLDLDDEDRDRALVAEDGFHHALGRWFLRQMHAAGDGVGAQRPKITSVLPQAAQRAAIVGMSGGVDSAVALHRIHEQTQGSVAGVTLRLWIDPQAPDPDSACCSPDSVRRARHTCLALGVPHLGLDLRSAFTGHVVAPFLSAWTTGETPNPCISCNGLFRLDELVRCADVCGAEITATGHYARRVERDGKVLIARGVDHTKDQSYMLASLAPETASRLIFPLGEQHKTQIRAHAAQLGLEQADVPDSQDVCFLGGGSYQQFLDRAGALGPAGEVVLDQPDGRVLRQHDGIGRFTIGQRRGVQVSRPAAGPSPDPLYVLDVDPATGQVIVGDKARLAQRSIELRAVQWHTPQIPDEVFVQPRYRIRGGALHARVEANPTARTATLYLQSHVHAPAPGQGAALYDSEGCVVGFGTICRALALKGVASTR